MSFEPKYRFPFADAVFRGRVRQVDYATASPGVRTDFGISLQRGVLVEVKEMYKGQVPDPVYFAYYHDPLCGGPPPFSVGSEYLFYSHQLPQGIAPIAGCARVVPMASAGEDYAYILGVNTERWPEPIRAVAHELIAAGVYTPWLLPIFALLGLAALYYHFKARRLIAESVR
jgi:hypothetical protein